MHSLDLSAERGQRKGAVAPTVKSDARDAKVTTITVRYWRTCTAFTVIATTHTDDGYIEFACPLTVGSALLRRIFPYAQLDIVPETNALGALLTFGAASNTSHSLHNESNENHIQSVKYQFFRTFCLKLFQTASYVKAPYACNAKLNVEQQDESAIVNSCCLTRI